MRYRAFFKERYWIYRYDFVKEARVVPLSDIYFGNTASHSLNQGDKRFSLVLMSVGILILIFAIINYINLTVAQAGQRAKEMATRRLLGSSRVELFLRLMLEATFLTVVSFAIGLMFAKAALPYANDLLQVRLTFDVLATPLWIGAILLFIVLTGALSGGASGIDDLIGQTDRRGTRDVPPADEDGVQQGLHHVPNVITIAMIAASLTMYLRIDHLIHAPLGYNTTNIIESDNIFRSKSEMERAEDMLRQLPMVKAVGHSNGTPSSGTNNMSGTYEDKSLSFQQIQVDSAAFRIFGFEIKSDNRVANADGGWYLNELAF